jgi:transmembrane sensor
LIDEAAAWLVRLHDPSCTQAQRRAFALWLEREEAHRVEFSRIEQTWRATGGINGDLAGLANARRMLAVHREQAMRTGSRGRRDFLAWLKIPALVAAMALLVLAGNAWMGSNVPGFSATYVTAVGEIRRIQLEDGTRILLNTDSKITVALYRTRRAVTLERGEGWFEVAPDASRPFRVAAGAANVEVVGTRFSVGNLGETVDVAVEEGTVRVFRTGMPADVVTLVRGQGIRIARHDTPLQVASTDVGQRTAWRSGRLIVSNRPLGEVAAELSRYRHTAIRLSSDVARLPVTGVINIRNADEWLAALPATLAVRTVHGANGDWDIAMGPPEGIDTPVVPPRRLGR